jgi:hypothetical protein
MIALSSFWLAGVASGQHFDRRRPLPDEVHTTPEPGMSEVARG